MVEQIDHLPPTANLQNLPTKAPTAKVRAYHDHLAALLTVASNTSPPLLPILHRSFESNLRVLHSKDAPLAPLDTALADRVRDLETRATQLSRHLQATREQCVTSLEHQLKQAHTCLAEIPDLPQSTDHPQSPSLQKKLVDGAPRVSAVKLAIEKVSVATRDTKHRAEKVREVLRIICDNAASIDDSDVSRTIAADWSDTFEHLDSLPHVASDSLIPLHSIDPDHSDSPLISPFITPRSKLRRRVARFSSHAVPKFVLPR